MVHIERYMAWLTSVFGSFTLVFAVDSNIRLCFDAHGNFDPHKNASFLPALSEALAVGVYTSKAVSAIGAWRQLESTVCSYATCWQLLPKHNFGFGSHLSMMTLRAKYALSKRNMPEIALHGALQGSEVSTMQALNGSLDARTAAVQRIHAADVDACGCETCANASLRCFFKSFAGGPTTCRNFNTSLPECNPAQKQKTAFEVDPNSLVDIGGSFWSSAAAYAIFTRPSSALKRELRDEFEKLSLNTAPRPWLGVHLRHGDSCRDGEITGRVCSPARVYLQVSENHVSASRFELDRMHYTYIIVRRVPRV